MYANRFGLTEDPFRVTPDRRFLFVGDVHGPVISKLRSVMMRPHGLCLLTGAPGVGKTLALLQVVGMLPENTPVSLLYNAHLDFRGFLNAVLSDFGVEAREDAEPPELIEKIESFVGECRASGRRPVVIVDEASNLSAEVVARLNELTEVHSDETQGVSVVLGSDLAHRDALVSQLGPDAALTEITVDRLSADEVVKYVEHRMRAAGWRDGATFYESAIERIAEVSGGVPRIINALAGKALFLTHLGGAQIVSRASVDEAAQELWAVANAPSAAPEGSAKLAVGLKAQMPSGDTDDRPRFVVDGQPVGADVVAMPEPPLSRSVERAPDLAAQAAGASAAHAPSRARRYAFLTAFALAAVAFAAKMSTESGQNEVIETARPVIKNVGKMANGIRDLVAPSDATFGAQTTHVDWVPPPQPVSVLTHSAGYASLQESAGSGEAANQVMPRTNRSEPPQAETAVAFPEEIAVPKTLQAETANDLSVSQRRRISQLMQSAADHIALRHYTEPAGANALEDYSEVLSIDPSHQGARRGMRAIAYRLELQDGLAEVPKKR